MWRQGSIFLTGVLLMACALTCVDGIAASTKDEGPASALATLPLLFEPTEELIYEAEFSKLLLRNINIAEFKFTAGQATANVPTTVNPAPAMPGGSTVSPVPSPSLFFTGDVVSQGWFHKLFGLNFHFRVESLVEPKSFHVLRTTKLDQQGKRVRTSEAIFNRVENKISWTERDPNDPQRAPRVVDAPLNGAAHDIITGIYFLRTQPLTPGQTFELAMSDSGQTFRIPVKISAEKKKMKSIVGKVPVLRINLEIFGQGRLIQDQGEMTLWVTNDARHLPVRARISSDLGTLNLTLKKISRGAR